MIRLTRAEQVGPTVAAWGTDGENEVMVQHIDLPLTEDGIFSALGVALEKAKSEPPATGLGQSPDEKPEVAVMAAPLPIPKASLERAAMVAARYQKACEEKVSMNE